VQQKYIFNINSGNQLKAELLNRNFVNAANRVIVPIKNREGKSGQYRATHRLIAGPGPELVEGSGRKCHRK